MIASLLLVGALAPMVLGRTYPVFFARELNSSMLLNGTGVISSSDASTFESTSAPSSTGLPTSTVSSDSVVNSNSSSEESSTTSSRSLAIVSTSSSINATISSSVVPVTSSSNTSSTIATFSTGSIISIPVNTSKTTNSSTLSISDVQAASSSVASFSITSTSNSSVDVSLSTSGTSGSSKSTLATFSTVVSSTESSVTVPVNGSVATPNSSSNVQSTALSTESSSGITTAASSSPSGGVSSTSAGSVSSTSAGAASPTPSTDSPERTTTLSSASTQIITSFGGSKVTTNTHISTTDSNGQQTIIPILFGCTFCGGGGLELFGFGSGPGIFDWPPTPDFSGLPPVTLDSDDNPSVEETSTPTSKQTTVSSTSSPSSSGSCTSSTTTEEYVTCYVATTSGLTTTSASCSTVTSTISGCDLTASATTTTTTATATCWQYNGWTTDDTDDEDDEDDEDVGTNVKRTLSEETDDGSEAHFQPILRKRANGYKTFGNCAIKNGVESPSYPKKSYFNKNAKGSKKQNTAITDHYWWEAVVDGNVCPGIAKLQRTSGEQDDARLKTFNMDHVYEQSIPSDFLSYLFSEADADICNAFEKIFADTSDANYPSDYKLSGSRPGKADQSRLQTLFNFLPNNENLALMAMDIQLNKKKGPFFNDKMHGLQYAVTNSDGTQKNLEFWNQLGMVFELLNTDVTQRLYSSVQDDMYAAWVRYDEIWADEACDKEPLNFAQRYKDFISTRLSTNAVSAQAWATSVSSVAIKYATTEDADGNLNAYGSAISSLKETYAPEKLTWSLEPYLQFPESTADIKKRAAACTATATAAVSQTAASTASASASASPSGAQSSSASAFETASASGTVPSTSSITSTACSFITTVFPSSLQSIAGTGTQRYCQCGETAAAINLATSGTSTTSYCALGSSAPSGYTQIPNSNGVAITTSTEAASSPSSTTATSAASSTAATTTATVACDSSITTSLDKLFEIFGKGWDGSILGNGAGLENALSDCSGNSIKNWGFYYKTDTEPIYDESGPTSYDFKANGSMSGINACFDTAALAQGGCRVGGSKVPATG